MPHRMTRRTALKLAGLATLLAGCASRPHGVATWSMWSSSPAEAEVWVAGKKAGGNAAEALAFPVSSTAFKVGGKKADASAAAEWTLTTPVLKPGETHTFEVRGRWNAGGKTYEATRSVTVKAGDRARLIVASGSEVGK